MSRAGREADTDAAARPALSPDLFEAVILDLDGVVTDTAEAHAAAWKRLFDAYREERAAREEAPFRPFDEESDYLLHLDGKPRSDGVRDFLASRGITLPEGSPDDGPDAETVAGLGNRKNGFFREWLRENRVRTFPDAIDFLRRAHAAGLEAAVISSSRNCAPVLKNAGAADFFEVRVDGEDLARLDIPGKPDPAIFLKAAQRLDVAPERACVVEDSLAGVEAGVSGGFGLVVGVDRTGRSDHGPSLRAHGAHVVVGDLRELVPAGEVVARPLDEVPRLFDRIEDVEACLGGRRPAVFLDFDGTLAPIVDEPAAARMPDGMRDALERLAVRCPVAVVSGRDLDDVRDRVGLEGLVYAGSHGFDVAGPDGLRERLGEGETVLSALEGAEEALRSSLAAIDGVAIERKTFSIAVHVRKVADRDVGAVEDAVDEAVAASDGLRKSRGKRVFQIQPDTDWDKGRAVAWLLERLGLDRPDVVPLFVGDDVTDEDAFRALAARGDGLAIVVRGDDGGGARATAARFALEGQGEVRRLLLMLSDLAAGTSP